MALSPGDATPIPSGDMVSLVSGPQRTFHVHANLLIYYSKFFTIEFLDQSEEASSLTFNLEGLADNISMTTYTDWIYARNHLGRTPNIFGARTLEQLMKSWLLGSLLLTPHFQNDVMEEMYVRSQMELPQNMEFLRFVVRSVNDSSTAHPVMDMFFVGLIAYFFYFYFCNEFDGDDCREILGELNARNIYKVVMCIANRFTTIRENGNQGDYYYYYHKIIGPIEDFMLEEY
ncbi:hypothetical protein F5X96DRAFT_632308 [Biscogniauxia mediterranea]|nr:hypothetical protein F5X96DRAFT_632308 [Biscogniauxia mediterranea]